MNICIYGAASSKIDKDFISAGETLGEKMAESGIGLIFGAGANGMMGAVARGQRRKGGKIIGVVPSFFNVDGVLFDGCDELVRTETMRERKKLLGEKADGYIVTPGGIGTLDEFFEILTLKQLARIDKPIVILNLKGFYNPMIDMIESFIAGKTIARRVTKLYFLTEDIDAAVDYIKNYQAKGINPEEYKDVLKVYR